MKNALPLILALVILIIGVGYWFTMQDEPSTPMVDDEPTNEESASDSEANDEPAGETGDDEAPADDSETEADYIGLTVPEAKTLAAENDVPFRVVERDGEPLPVTMDYRPGRINATVENDIVVSYEVEGSGADQEVAGDEQGDPDANRSDNGEERGAAGDNESMADKHDVIIGMTEGEAAAYAEASDVPFRVGVRDGEPLPLTRDYRPGRITAEVEDGLVTGYSVE